MQFPQTTRLNGDRGCSDIFRRQEVTRVNYANFTAPRLLRGGHSLHSKSVLVRGFGPTTPTAALSCARDAGKSAGKMYRLLFGKFLRALAGSPKFFDNTDGGVRLTQSERRKVLSSENAPSSNTSRNSQPSGPNPWMEWGNPAGKYQRSPLPTSPINTVPSGLRQVTRAFPYSMKDHSSAVCQCSSRKLPAVSRILTPARSFEDGNTFCVTSFVQPPSSIRCELDRRSTIQGQHFRNLSAEEDLNSDFRPKEACFPGPDYLQNDLVLLFQCLLSPGR